MTESKKTQGYVKTENTILIALITLAVGFAIGTVFGVIKTPSSVPSSKAGMPPIASKGVEHAAEIEALKQKTVKNPSDSESWIQLGHLYFDSDQSQEAIKAYEAALKIAPNNPDVLTDLGVMYRRSGNPKKAIEKFDQAMAIDPTHEVSRFNKGIVLMHDLNDPKGAAAAWRELVKINPEAKAPNGQLVKEILPQFEKQIAK